jgi:hypothetical protein
MFLDNASFIGGSSKRNEHMGFRFSGALLPDELGLVENI